MAKQRKDIPKLTQKRIYQEAGSRCAFCQESEVTSLAIHHMDSNPENNIEDNLILVCSNCHGKITHGVLSQADVVFKKREVHWGSGNYGSKPGTPVSVVVDNSVIIGDVANTITKISTKKNSLKVLHPQGSIGGNLTMKAYVDYLIGRYFEFKKADSSYGRNMNFSHAVIHRNIQKALGGRTFYLPEDKFQDLVKFLQGHIDQTIQGKVNRKKGVTNYHSFQEHIEKYEL
ncbi:MAG: HNH endonuclease signature motif containing protein [Syntrophales bacterium]|nr:HNH endonuclease signature motif containing protein [Syntrophales bacterium]